MQVKIKLKIKTFEKVLGALDVINSSVKGEPYTNIIILRVNINEIPINIKI